jgi:hypothetical protein
MDGIRVWKQAIPSLPVRSKRTSVRPPDIRVLVEMSPGPIVDSRNKLVLLWSAKSGCTFAVKWMFSHMGLLEEAAAYHPWIHKYRTEQLYYSRRHIAAVEDFCNSPSSYRFVRFVRQPFRRAVSSYIHALRCGYEDSKISAYLGVDVHKTSRFSFREFVRYLASIDLTSCEVHHRLQTHPLERHLTPGSSFLVNIGHSMESLPKLEAFLGLPQTDLRHYRQSHHHTYTSSITSLQSSADIRFDITRKSGALVPDYLTFYDSELEGSVYTLYAEDFLRYGFSTTLGARNL